MPVMMLPAAPGKCQFCAGAHGPMEPHNKDSLFYQMRFNGLYGRWPTWADAVSHCSDKLRRVWTQALKDRGVWNEPEDGKLISEFETSDGQTPAPIPMPHLEPQVVQFQRKKRKPTFTPKWKCRICGSQFEEKKVHGCLNGTNPKNWGKISLMVKTK